MTNRIFILLFLVLLLSLPTAIYARPKQKQITLNQHTPMVIHIPRGKGVRFTLPFLINEQDDIAPFSIIITNPAFHKKVGKKTNSFTIWLPHDSKSDARGNMFFNIAGYEVTAELIGSMETHTKKHISNYFFKLGKKDKELFIQDIVRQRTQALELEYKRKEDSLNELANKMALSRVGELVLHDPLTKTVKEEKSLTLVNGDQLTAYVDEMLVYGKYTLIKFQLDLDSNNDGLAVKAVKLFSRNFKSKIIAPIDSIVSYPKRLPSNKKTYGVVTAYTKHINFDNEFVLKVMVQDDMLELIW